MVVSSAARFPGDNVVVVVVLLAVSFAEIFGKAGNCLRGSTLTLGRNSEGGLFRGFCCSSAEFDAVESKDADAAAGSVLFTDIWASAFLTLARGLDALTTMACISDSVISSTVLSLPSY